MSLKKHKTNTFTNKTEKWKNVPPTMEYNLPLNCPKCKGLLQVHNIMLGVFPYQFTDCEIICDYCGEIYKFCFPLYPIMPEGLHIYSKRPVCLSYPLESIKGIICPFHNVEMGILRIYGDMVYTDDTEKAYFKCSKCNYYKIVQLT